MLSEGRYTARELQRIVPREVVMGSSLVDWVKKRSRAEGLAKGRAQGELAAARALCLDLAKQQYPGVPPLVAPIIQGCPDPQLLREWALAVPRSSEAEFVRLVTEAPAPRQRRRGGTSASRTRHGRAPAPSRRSRRPPKR